MSKLTVTNLGRLGVNVTRGPLHTQDGELLSAQNAELRANRALSGLVKRLGLGSFTELVGEVLQLVSFGAIPPAPDLFGTGFGPIVWNIMRCKLYLTGATTSVADNTATKVSWTAEAWDVGDMHDLVSNPTRIICPPDGDGLYLVIGQAQWATLGASGTKKREIRILKNNLAVYGDAAAGADDDGDVFSHQVTALVPMVYGDYLEMSVEQDSGGALDLVGSSEEKTWIAVVRLVPTVTWQLPRVHVNSTPNVTLTRDVPLDIPFDAEVFDTHAMHDGGQPARLTIPTDQGGLYFVQGQVARDGTQTTGYVLVQLVKYDTVLVGETVLAQVTLQFINTPSDPDATATLGGVYVFVPTDYVTLRAVYIDGSVGPPATTVLLGAAMKNLSFQAARVG